MEISDGSRLCAACGMCCNGMMFHSVILQAGDPVNELKTLGVRMKHKKKHDVISQPCPAFRGDCCAVYEHRPARCRHFVCKQLQKYSDGEIPEEAAFKKIHDARRLGDAILELLPKAGSTNRLRSLQTRYEAAMDQPVGDTPEAVDIRRELTENFGKLVKILAEDFRVE